MKKKIAALAPVLLAIAGISYSGAHYPDVCLPTGETGSVLCAGLIEHYELTDPTDSPRFGAGMSYLQEKPGVNVAYHAAATAVDFNAGTSDFLWANISAPADAFTIAFRVQVQTLGASGAKQSILSWHNSNFKGPDIYFENNAGTGRICLGVYEAETTTPAKTACSGTVFTNSWYFVAVGASPYHEGKSNIFISLNAGARTTTTTGYWQHGGLSYMRVGGRPVTGPADVSDQALDGYLCELDLYARPLSDYELTLLYNGGGWPGAALTFPYDTN